MHCLCHNCYHNHYSNHYLCHNHCHYHINKMIVSPPQCRSPTWPACKEPPPSCLVMSPPPPAGSVLLLIWFLSFCWFFLSFCVRFVFGAFYCFLGFLSFLYSLLFDFITPDFVFGSVIVCYVFYFFSCRQMFFSSYGSKTTPQSQCTGETSFFCQPITTRRQLDMKKKSFVFMMYATPFAHSCSKFERHHHYHPPFYAVAGYHSFEVSWIIDSHFISVERSREEKRRRKLWRFKKWQNFHTCTDPSPWDMTNPFPLYLNKTYLRHKHSKSQQFSQSLSWIQNPNTIQSSSFVNQDKKFLFMPSSSLLYPVWKDRQAKMERHDNLVNWIIFIV